MDFFNISEQMLSRHKGQNFGSTCKIHSQQTYDIKEATSACYLPISDGKWYRLPNPIALSDTMNTVRRLNSNMECFAATVPLFGLLKSSVPTENHFCVKLQWVRRLSQCSEKNQVEMRLAKTIGPTCKRVFVTNLKGFWWVNLCSIASNNEHSRCKD